VLRAAAAVVEARFLVVQVVARGRVIEAGTEHFFVAGNDRFLLIEPPAASSPLPPASDTVLTVIATVDDSGNPIKLKLLQFQPATESDGEPRGKSPQMTWSGT
jgi:hypothetical protein